MLWLALALVVLAGVVVYEVRRGRRTPVLLLVRDREEELEGLVRNLLAKGRLVFVMDLGSADGSRRIAARLARESGVRLLTAPDVAEALWSVPSAVVTVVSLLGPWEMREIVRQV